jgi:transcriptional regulator with XRE-family HTH domain
MSAMNRNKLWKVIGRKIKEARVDRSLSLTVLAKRAGYCKAMISMVEHGKNSLAVEGLVKIAKILDVQVGDLISDRRLCKRCDGRGWVRS